MKSLHVLIALVVLALLVVHVHAQNTGGADALRASTAESQPAPQTPGAGRSALEFAERQIQLETQRLDKLIMNTETVGKLMATLVVVFAAAVSFFGYRSIKELKNEMQSAVEIIVDRALKDRSKSCETFDQLVVSLDAAQARWVGIRDSLDNLAKFETLSGSQDRDAQGAYGIAKELSQKENVTPDERRAALGYLLKIVELGEQGRVDPNLLFNSCSVAADMDFQHEALKLACLCAHWDPKPSHVLRKSRHEDAFGMRFSLEGHQLVLSEESASLVRKEAWQTARDMVRQAPTYQCELIFSDFHNIAIRNRESGYIDDAIAVMEDLTTDGTAPSYAFATLSDFYAMRGDSTWSSDYLAAVTKAIKILAGESPACTWYEHTTRDIMKMAARTGKNDVVAKIVSEKMEALASNPMDGDAE
jgi:hypothetical protein